MTYTIYELKLKPQSSWITDLTADTIFGHLCWQIKYEFSKDVLKEFLKEMEDKPIFTISDVLPVDRLSRPLTEFDEKNKDFGNQTDNSLFLKRRKKYNKEISYISEDELSKFSNYNEESIKNIINKKVFDNENNYLKTYFGIGIDNKNVIDRYFLATGDNGIYSQEYKYFKENERNKVVRILLKKIRGNVNLEKYIILGKEINFFELIKKVFGELGYGKKKSTGKGIFKVGNWKEKKISIENKGHILLLSNFIPSKEDPTDGNYKLFTKFPKLGEEFSLEGQNFYKKPLVMIQAGATFKKNNNYKGYVGRMIKNVDFMNKGVYHYGYGFTLEF